jgi:hypothetical protein
MIFLAAVLVVALGFMALTLTRQSRVKMPLTEDEKEIQEIQTQSKSDDVSEIEKDLNNTDLMDLDKELPDIENEFDATY